jgi:hypothetical protein
VALPKLLTITSRNFHWAATAALAVALLPLTRFARVKFDAAIVSQWSVWIIFWSLVTALFLYMFGVPKEFLAKIDRGSKLTWITWKAAAAALLCAVYFNAGFILVVLYNPVIAALRFTGKGDALLTRLDSRLLDGGSVSAWAHWALQRFPWSFRPMEIIYFAMFPLIGAAILLVAASYGIRRGIQFVGAMLTAYYVALATFFIIPTTGPYLTDLHHLKGWPVGSIYAMQLLDIQLLTGPKSALRASYLIGLPCMHIVKPLIAAWFLRKRGWLGWLFALYSVLLAPCVLLLDQHYVVDVIGGIALAPICILCVEDRKYRKQAVCKPSIGGCGVTRLENLHE